MGDVRNPQNAKKAVKYLAAKPSNMAKEEHERLVNMIINSNSQSTIIKFICDCAHTEEEFERALNAVTIMGEHTLIDLLESLQERNIQIKKRYLDNIYAYIFSMSGVDLAHVCWSMIYRIKMEPEMLNDCVIGVAKYPTYALYVMDGLRREERSNKNDLTIAHQKWLIRGILRDPEKTKTYIIVFDDFINDEILDFLLNIVFDEGHVVLAQSIYENLLWKIKNVNVREKLQDYALMAKLV